MGNKILILGATGKTGRLTLKKLVELDQNVTIGGRNKPELEALSAKYHVPHLCIDIKDKGKLISIFKNFNTIINLVGPFTSLGYIPVNAAIAARVHYLDSSWEQEFFYNLNSYHDYAVKNKVAIVSGIGMSPGVSDLMVASGYQEFDEIQNISIHYVEGMQNRFSYGSLISAAKALKSQSLFFSGGQFVPVKAGGKTKEFVFRNKFKKQKLISYPTGDVVTIPRYIKTDSVESYFGAEAVTITFLILSMIPFNTDSSIIRNICKAAEKLQYLTFWGNTGFAITVELKGRRKGKETTNYISLISEKDPYQATANLLAYGAKYLIESRVKEVGILSPGQAFNSIELLEDSGLHIS